MAETQATRKQVLAARYYHEGMSKLAAVTAAGFAHPQDALGQVFTSKGLRKELEALQSEARERHQLKVDDVLQGLKDALPMAATATELVMIWREIGKIIGAYDRPVEIDVRQRVEHVHSVKQLELLTDKQLAELAQLGDEKVLEGEYDEVVD